MTITRRCLLKRAGITGAAGAIAVIGGPITAIAKPNTAIGLTPAQAHQMDSAEYAAIRKWAEDNGLPWKECADVEVIDEHRVRVTEYLRNAEGKRYADPNNHHMAARRIFGVYVRSPMPYAQPRP